MQTFIEEDFLLKGETAKKLYHDYAKDLPIIDFHNHLVPEELLTDRSFSNLTDVWLGGDHYKWRAMRTHGVEESLISGSADPKAKFDAWADTVPNLIGNPLYHWTHLELSRYFDINSLLNNQTKDDIYEKTAEMLSSGGVTTHSVLKKSRVEFLGTTDDPADPLDTHRKLQQADVPFTAAPSFRADQAIHPEKPTFLSWVEKLGNIQQKPIETYDDFLEALSERIDAFDAAGCRASDHGINRMFYKETGDREAAALFSRRLYGGVLNEEEAEKLKTHTMLFLGEKYAEKGWAMQLHIGPLRNNYTKKFHEIGADSGFDSIGDAPVAEPLAALLDRLASKEALPKTVLFTLNPRDNPVLAAMAGNYQEGGIPGKVQFGTAWWHNDHEAGMIDQMTALASIGVIRHFIGMLTDSRSVLSMSRHEYFRRLLSSLIGGWVDDGKAPNDEALLKEYIEGICYKNAKAYFNLT
ncbi:glucuronate isomerase [Alkalicoccus urumqiensis]|uniref:Uronate isomerase n=1 Tax=Alkalicoccus urumqiensis TaxID=1548213 RepID=A0A2P6MJP8_ALKUR|nr:glucuronate isomerase [Alkalicoccus urumqiensis]PRO66495.1 glucuronate isomerase [Alkalicoccus urumqiensis]